MYDKPFLNRLGIDMNNWLILLILILYMALLFACAIFGEKYTNQFNAKGRMVLFSLTLGVYCSSWTFFGASSIIVHQGILFLPIYLGPLLFIAIGYDIWRRLGRVRRHHTISSIADFVSARYGKSGTLAGLVTILAVIAIVPYLALQLRAISLSSHVLLNHSVEYGTQHLFNTHDIVFFLTAILSILAMLFSTRQIANTEQHGGLMLAVAFESFVKLFALLAVALFFLLQSSSHLSQVHQDIQHTFSYMQQHGVPDTFWTQVLLASLAMICLPRQFHVAVVELGDEQHIKGARVWFSLYLILTVCAIIPIASWAIHDLPAHLSSETAVLTLPLMFGQDWLAILAFLGGFSASTGMLLLSSVALSIMLSNDLIIPTLWKLNILSRQDPRFAHYLKIIRCSCIVLVMFLGYWFFHLFEDIQQLSFFGLLAFSAVAQFAPTLIGGLYWRGGSKQAVFASLIVGFSVWAYTLLFPTILKSLPDYYVGQYPFLEQGLFGWQWLHPQALFGFSSLHPFTHGVFWSLTLNIITYIWVSKWIRPSVAEQIQAERFFYYAPASVSPQNMVDTQPEHELLQHQLRLKVRDLFALAQRITGYQSTEHAFQQFCQKNNLPLNYNVIANGMWWRFTEQYLASAIGSASARTLLTSAMVNDGLALGQVANILDQASRWQRFNQNLLMTMIDNMTLGISVVDENMCLVAWNQQYLKLFDYPDHLVYVGCPIADLIRYNAERGECGEGSVEEHIRKRITWMQMGNSHEFERIRKNGQVIQMRGAPIEGGGFVTTFADITAFREQEAILEARVQARTQELADALTEQQRAREQADIANMAKSRFIAAASHDLLQPMHAARLFSTALEHSTLSSEDRKTLEQLDRALHGAESMLSALLDIARLESGTLQPKRQSYPLHDLLSDLKLQFQSIAQQRDIQLRVHDTHFWIDTDPQWIRRIIQNFVSNALRYTAQGKVIVGILRSASRPQHIRIGVWDTGLGISEQQKQKLFLEFERCGHTSPWGEQGLGLGLAIVQRMTQLLDYPLHVYSKLNHGSCFMIEVPLSEAPKQQHNVPTTHLHNSLQHRVLCFDNDETILQGMRTLLEKWGHQVYSTTNHQQALEIIQQQQPDVWLIDQHLNHDLMGIDFIQQHRIDGVPIALITADSDPDLPQKLKALNIILMKKPLKPAQLRAWLNSLK